MVCLLLYGPGWFYRDMSETTTSAYFKSSITFDILFSCAVLFYELCFSWACSFMGFHVAFPMGYLLSSMPRSHCGGSDDYQYFYSSCAFAKMTLGWSYGPSGLMMSHIWKQHSMFYYSIHDSVLWPMCQRQQILKYLSIPIPTVYDYHLTVVRWV